ncbi:MAG TPA: glycerol-3-phosphate responsive antiterminator [Edaphobacter sp.]
MSKTATGFYSSEQHARGMAQDNVRMEHTVDARAQLADCPIIAAVNTVDMIETALDSPARSIYLIAGNPLNLPDILKRTRERGKTCLVNIDFLDGLARDRYAVEWLAQNGADGIVSTRIEPLKAAHQLKLITVQRTFAIDSAAVSATIRSLGQFLPDAMEILPAIAAPRVARRIHASFPDIAIIGGGLIESVREIEDLLKANIRSVSVSDSRLWLI